MQAPSSEIATPAETELSGTSAQLALDSFFCLSMDIMCLLDFEGRFLRTNPACERILGHSDEELANKSLIEMALPADQEALRNSIGNLTVGGQAVTLENRIRCRNGLSKSLHWNFSTDADPRFIYATAHDITRRQDAEESTRRVDMFLTNIVENLPHMIFVKDAQDLRFVRLNKAMEQVIGFTQAEMLGKNDHELFPGEEAQFFIEVDRAVLESGDLLDIPDETVHCAQGARIFHTKKIPLLDEDGRPQYLLGIAEDITERKQAEDELSARNALIQTDLELARAMQEAFLTRQQPFESASSSGDDALTFHHRNIPHATLGGDFFQVTKLSETRTAVFICDVMGHGVRSALVTAMIRALVTEKSLQVAQPGEFLGAVNSHLFGILDQARTPMFASAFYLIADTANGKITFASAGHPSPLRVRRSLGEVAPLLPADMPAGPALGIMDGVDFHSFVWDLAPGDLIVFHTDGLFEVAGLDEEFGEERLAAALKTHAALPTAELFDALLSEIRDYSVTGEFEDDVCLLGMDVGALNC